MKKLILLIGVLTYSSLGWSQSLMMECLFDDKPYLSGIYRINFDQKPSSKGFLTLRTQGSWKELCFGGRNSYCTEEGPKSVSWFDIHRDNQSSGGGKMVTMYLDFVFFRVTTEDIWNDHQKSLLSKTTYYKCENLE